MTENKTKKLPLSVKIFLWFSLFALVLILLLWLFQTFFLDDIYQFVKTSELKNLPSTIASRINKERDLTEYIAKTAQDKDSCIMIINSRGGALYNAHSNRDCVIHKLFNDRSNLAFLFSQAKENGGSYFKEVDFGNTGNLKFENNYISACIINSNYGELCILVNSSVMPLNATVTTLKYQLIFITIIMLLFALVFAIIVSRRITSPIRKINESAKLLSEGNYGVEFVTSGSKEISELGTTLNYAASELNKTEQYRNDLVANISHDMRTPLTMITGYGEVMRDIPGENNPENIQIIIDEANRLSVLVNDALNLSKLQSGKDTVSPSAFSITDLCRDTVNRISKMTAHDGYSVEFNSDENISVYADKTKIQQAIYNLLTNAVNYTGESKKVKVFQRVFKENNIVRIEIADFGEGIPKDELHKIWDRYYKLDKEHKRATTGSGLGLFIVKTIMELHGTNYGVASEIGVGSTFWFDLPILSEN